ncbi:MAG: hypothetical protein M1834_008977 [Cirrosporium novae-zelandiae]|nr:MAG: hypothetical protein M1834_008977 [Cirrosporium novae-zelandiae]
MQRIFQSEKPQRKRTKSPARSLKSSFHLHSDPTSTKDKQQSHSSLRADIDASLKLSSFRPHALRHVKGSLKGSSKIEQCNDDSDNESICVSPTWDDSIRKEKRKMAKEQKELKRKLMREQERQEKQDALKSAGQEQAKRLSKRPPAAMDTQKLPSSLRRSSTDTEVNSIKKQQIDTTQRSTSFTARSRSSSRVRFADEEISTPAPRSRRPSTASSITDTIRSFLPQSWKSDSQGSSGKHSKHGSNSTDDSKLSDSEDAYRRDLVEFTLELNKDSITGVMGKAGPKKPSKGQRPPIKPILKVSSSPQITASTVVECPAGVNVTTKKRIDELMYATSPDQMSPPVEKSLELDPKDSKEDKLQLGKRDRSTGGYQYPTLSHTELHYDVKRGSEIQYRASTRRVPSKELLAHAFAGDQQPEPLRSPRGDARTLSYCQQQRRHQQDVAMQGYKEEIAVIEANSPLDETEIHLLDDSRATPGLEEFFEAKERLTPDSHSKESQPETPKSRPRPSLLPLSIDVSSLNHKRPKPLPTEQLVIPEKSKSRPNSYCNSNRNPSLVSGQPGTKDLPAEKEEPKSPREFPLSHHRSPKSSSKATPKKKSVKPAPKTPEVIVEGIDGDGIRRSTSIKHSYSTPQLLDFSFLPELPHQSLAKHSKDSNNPPTPNTPPIDSHLLTSKASVTPHFSLPTPPSSRPPSGESLPHKAPTELPASPTSLALTPMPLKPRPSANSRRTRSSHSPGSNSRDICFSTQTGTDAARMKPIAKMFVICCKCRFWHDLPSRVYEEMVKVRDVEVEGKQDESERGKDVDGNKTGAVLRRLDHSGLSARATSLEKCKDTDKDTDSTLCISFVHDTQKRAWDIA